MVDALSAQGVTVMRHTRQVVAAVSFRAQAGELLAITGPNGAGKSTLLKALLGLIPSAGDVRVAGVELRGLSASARARLVGYVPQRSALVSALSVYDVVAQARHAQRRALPAHVHRRAVDDALARVGLSALVDRSYDTLSGGEQRRVLLARALASSARVLLLDEPTAGLDVSQVLRFFGLLAELKREGYALVCVLHDLADVLRYAEQTLLLVAGEVAGSGPTESVLSAGNVRRVYGVHSHERAVLGFSLDGSFP